MAPLPSWLLGLLRALGLALLFVLVRGPLHRATFGLPVSNDDAIPLLMARHLLRGEMATTLWNQPYNGVLDAYLLAPGLGLASAHQVFRTYELLCAALLVWLVFLLARAAGGAPAGWAAAGLAAFGTPYMGLMTATGPPPNFLMPLVTGFPLAIVLGRCSSASPSRAGARGTHGFPAPTMGPGLAAALGLACGLAVWNSSLAIPAFVGMAAGLVAAGEGPGRGWLCLAPSFVAGVVLGASPLVLARVIGASGAKVVTASSAVTALRAPGDWLLGVSDLVRALTGLVGLQVPLVVDGAERAALPIALAIALGVGLLALLVSGGLPRRSWPLVLWALALLGAFALSRRTGPDELRYLYGVNAPLLALLGIGLAPLWTRGRLVVAVAAAAVLLGWWGGHLRVAQAWADPAHAARVWQVPPLGPVLDTLGRAPVESAYASLQFAGRLSLASEERVLASQAWNERIPGDPLRFRDEVDLDPRAAWVLSPHLSRGMPRAGGFRELLQGLGGTWREDLAGDFVVFRSFGPPYDEGRPVPSDALVLREAGGGPLGDAVLDRDPATVWTGALGLRPGAGLEIALRAPRRLDALVLAVDLEASPLAVPWIAFVDGVVAAHGPARHGLQWVNGAPRAARQALLVVTLGGRSGGAVRLLFQGAGPPLRIAEVFLYGPDEVEQPRSGQEAEGRGLLAARAGRWADAAASYGEAARREPERASHYAALLRSRWRAAHRQRLDVEGLTDGGPEIVGVR